MMSAVFNAVVLSIYLLSTTFVGADYQSAGCSDEGCGIPCYLRPAEDDCHYTEHDPCDSGGATELDEQLRLLNNSLVRLQEKLIQKGIIPAGGTCPPLLNIENGGVIYSDLLLSIGVIANYVCTGGFSLHGHGRYECSVDGVWIGNNSLSITMQDVPVCEESLVVCAALVPIPFGHISYYIVDTTIVQPGDVASYSCDTLYTLQGTEHRICLRNGTWSGMEPECVAPVTEQVKNSTQGRNHDDLTALIVTLPLIAIISIIIVTVVIILLWKWKFILTKIQGTRKSYQTLNEGGTSVHYDGSKEHTASLILSGESNSKSEPKVITLEAEK